MKAFYVALVLFTIMLGLIITNSLYVNSTCSELCNVISQLDPRDESCPDFIDLLYGLWRENEAYLSLSIAAGRSEVIEAHIAALQEYYDTQEYAEFKRSAKQLYLVFEEISALERLRWDNIF